MFKKYCITMIGLLLLSNELYAGCDANGCIGIGDDVLASVYVNGHSEGRIYLQPPAATKAKLDCTLVQGYYMTLKSTHPLFKEVYSTVMTALASQKKLQVRTINGSSICEVAYVRMYVD